MLNSLMKGRVMQKFAFKQLAMPLALSVMVQMSGLVALTADAANFTDTQGHWAQAKINQLADHSVIGGYPDGTFKPEATITRAEFAAILVKSFKLQPSQGGSSFYDVPSSFWGSPLIESVQKAGLMSGYPGNQFKPNKPVSRAEVMAIMAKAFPAQSPNADAATQILANFADGYQVPTWAQPAVAETIQTGIYANNPQYMNSIQPNRAVTRGEVAAMTDNLLTKLVALQQTQSATQNVASTTETTTGTTVNATNMGTQTQQQQVASNPNTTAPYTPYNSNQQPLQGRLVTIPAQTEFSGTLTAPFSSETAQLGDSVTLTVDSALVSSDNVIVVPNGSQLVGEVTMVEPSGRLGKNAQVNIRFKEIVKTSGERFAIQGSVATTDGLLEGGTAKGRLATAAKNTAIGAGAGAALGTAMGALSGGETGKGAIYGTAIGGGLGAAKAALTKGNALELIPGTRLKVKLDQPIQMTVN